ncbi:MAG: hypothetical protein LC790_17015, partial [Actinobacteria bacterium]|nr:hypothetical protein [Actinomycetota bacterium]
MSIPALVRRLLPYAWRRRGAMLVVAAAMLLQVGLAALAPWPMKVIVDNALGGKPLPGWLGDIFHALPGPATRETLLWWATGTTAIVFILVWAVGLAL